VGKGYKSRYGFSYLHPTKTISGVDAKPPSNWIMPPAPVLTGQSGAPVASSSVKSTTGETVSSASISVFLNALTSAAFGDIYSDDCNLLPCDISYPQVDVNLSLAGRRNPSDVVLTEMKAYWFGTKGDLVTRRNTKAEMYKDVMCKRYASE
jgi:hypothetical protein